MTLKLLKTLAATAALAAFAAHAAPPLPQYNVDTSQATVSGLSAGGFMANQLGYAYSSYFKGIGVFAAGPYMCAGHNNYTACMYNAAISAGQLTTMQNSINAFSSNGTIDNKANVASQKVYLFVGSSDYTVGTNPMVAARTQYTNNGVTSANLEYVQRSGTAHVFPTDFDATGNNACSSSASPYVSNCGYDGAKAVLSKFYGTLNPRNNAPAAGNYIAFDQAAFSTNPGMDSTGWVYVPADCAAGAQCKVHVALHGCQQGYAKIGDKFIKNTGYTRWADTNGIIVLFPQARVDNTNRQTAASGSLPNPNGCWDWVGWYGNTFARQAGTQVAAIKAMVDHLSSGTGSGGGTPVLPAPIGLATSDATTSSIKISWSAVTGAASYNVYRAGNKTNALPVTATHFTDNGLQAGTSYSWTVRAADANGVEGAASAPVSGTTVGTPPPVATCHTSSNYHHVGAGRATTSLGYTYAKGSGQNMGLYNVFYTTTLKMTGTNHYVIGSCP